MYMYMYVHMCIYTKYPKSCVCANVPSVLYVTCMIRCHVQRSWSVLVVSGVSNDLGKKLLLSLLVLAMMSVMTPVWSVLYNLH